MSATGGAGLTKLTEIADNTDELESITSGIEVNTDGVATSAKQDDIISELQSLEAGLITNNPFNGYGLYAWNDDNTNFYAMYQNASGAWIVIKIANSTGVTTYATGSSDASTNWTNRASLTYQDYATSF